MLCFVNIFTNYIITTNTFPLAKQIIVEKFNHNIFNTYLINYQSKNKNKKKFNCQIFTFSI